MTTACRDIIRSSFSIDGVKLVCEAENGEFLVYSRWQRFYRSRSIDEALTVFEGLCQETLPTKAHTKRLMTEMRRNRRHQFVSGAAWERRVIECARRRAEGLVPRLCGSKGSVEDWRPA